MRLPSRLRLSLLTSPFLLGLLLGACGGGGGNTCGSSSDCSGGLVCIDGTCQTGGGLDGSLPDGGTPDSGLMCLPSQQCGDLCCEAGTVCGGDRCCAPAERCGGVCCGPDQTCEADRCVLDCAETQAACGEVCCAEGDLCYLGACTTPGIPCAESFECPDGQYCESTVGACLPRATTGEACEYRPMIESFELSEEWHWNGDPTVLSSHNQVMMAPMVANLTDDNGDGRIDQDDIPEVIFNTFAGSQYRMSGVLRAISGADGARVWPTADPGYRTTPGAEVAIADVEPSSPGPEVMTCSTGPDVDTAGFLLLIAADGSLLRTFDGGAGAGHGVRVPCRFDAPAIGDMDGDGTPEIALRQWVVHADGSLALDVGVAIGGFVILYDVDDDPDLEVLTYRGAWNLDGTPVWTNSASQVGHTAVADLDLDGSPELVVTTSLDTTLGSPSIRALNARTGELIWGPVDTNPDDPAIDAAIAATGRPDGGGPPTIANFDDDPEPEIAMAGGFAYVIFEGDGSLKWYFITQDRSSRSTGSSIFDFEGDGVAEVLYNDELRFRVFAGPDGSVLLDRCNTSGTIREYPIVVDVDNDDHAEIVLMGNNYAFSTCAEGGSSQTGIFAFGHPTNQWVRTRRIWNQHTYHVTNINEDGTVPRREARNWESSSLNNFRQNVQPDGLFDAPDLVIRDMSAGLLACSVSLDFRFRVVNEGRAGAPAGVPVTVYETSMGRVRVDRVVTTRPLLPGESELLEVRFTVPAGRERDTFRFEAVINDPAEMPLIGVNECREENNTSEGFETTCPSIE